jgi:hypothetical protein
MLVWDHAVAAGVHLRSERRVDVRQDAAHVLAEVGAPQPETVVKLLPTKLMFLMSIEPSRKLPAMSCDTCSIFSAA